MVEIRELIANHTHGTNDTERREINLWSGVLSRSLSKKDREACDNYILEILEELAQERANGDLTYVENKRVNMGASADGLWTGEINQDEEPHGEGIYIY